MEQLDYKNVVFGRIIKGYKNLCKIGGYARKIGKPYVEIIISNCGEIDPAAMEKLTDVGTCDVIDGDSGNVNVGRPATPESSMSGCTCLQTCQCFQSN